MNNLKFNAQGILAKVRNSESPIEMVNNVQQYDMIVSTFNIDINKPGCFEIQLSVKGESILIITEGKTVAIRQGTIDIIDSLGESIFQY